AALRFKESTARRINVAEPDGTPHLIISDRHDFHGAIINGHDYPFQQDTAGMLFYNNEGSESGGLIFGGHKSKDGKPTSWGT
ncbi:hypothetical protein B1A_15237, partial [mine drainage metagenome]